MFQESHARQLTLSKLKVNCDNQASSGISIATATGIILLRR